MDFQLKATTRYAIGDSSIAYDLRAANYNQLVAMDDLPRILILFLMTEDPAQWLSHTADELCLRQCAYWTSLMGRPRSSNASTHRVHAPLANPFHPDGLLDMFDEVGR